MTVMDSHIGSVFGGVRKFMKEFEIVSYLEACP